MENTFSYWEQGAFFKGFDVLIIGSGIVGLSAALNLKSKNQKLKIGILESGFLPSGASTKNAGFACFGSVSELIDELNSSGEDELLKLVEMRWIGLQKLRKNLGDKAICFNQFGGYELFRNNEAELANSCIENIPYLNKILSPIIGTTDIFAVNNHEIASFGFANSTHLIKNKNEGQIDTGKMMHALLSKVQGMGISIFNNCRVEKIEYDTKEKILISNQGRFLTRKVILASNAFIKDLFPEVDVKPGRGQVLISEEIKNLKIKGCFHYNRGFTYFRNIDNRVLLGGARDLDFEGEETYNMGITNTIQNALEKLLEEVILPNQKVKIESRWSGIMGFGSELKPIVKELKSGIFCAVRCNGMGVAMGSLLGEQVAELIDI
ncbi:NAD(P)/FAD-dependent oxidoreductase [Daejeonella sp.]|jgi:gamma-glutamylputrescine oxidase|uniref:NAD(P)/FAD-dependent oxidoreductase n=1 Tax=Daejeonella sp. TaxID=2805397 RepID=UPI0037C0B720